MEINKIVYMSDYISELTENLDLLEDLLIQYNNDKNNKAYFEPVLGTLNAMKSSSIMMDFKRIEAILQLLEDLIVQIKNEQFIISPVIVQLFISVSQKLREAFEKMKDGGDDQIPDEKIIIKNLKAAINGEEFSTTFNGEASAYDENKQGSETETVEGSKTISVGISKINGIIHDFDRLIMREHSLKSQLNNLTAKILAESKDNERLCRLVKETLEVMETQSQSLQDNVLSLRMIPFDMILQPFKRNMVKEFLSSKKNIVLDIPHTDKKIDKVILEKLPSLLTYFIQNSVEHGIESEQERIKAGKPVNGTISIRVSQAANRILLTIRDDGRGIDFEKIRERAALQYPNRAVEIQSMDSHLLSEFLFAPGFTIVKKTKENNDKGMGLAVVKEEFDKLRAKINVNTEVGKKTEFIVSMPVSLAAQTALYVVLAGQKMLILSYYIKDIVSVNRNSFIKLQTGPVVSIHNELLPVYNPQSIFGGSGSLLKDKDEQPLIVIEYMERRIAVLMDQILNYTTVVVKPLPPVYKKFKAVQGVVFDEEYAIIPVLNIPDIMHRFKILKEYDVKNLEVKNKRKEYSVLIVDDSATTRHIEQVIFETEHYKVYAACDGIEALELLKNNKVDLLVSDIEMPRMDGFTLLHNIRHSDEYKNIPVIIVSSVYEEFIAQKIKANDGSGYIVKADFEREKLIAMAKELLNE